jgi:hypothetical protein
MQIYVSSGLNDLRETMDVAVPDDILRRLEKRLRISRPVLVEITTGIGKTAALTAAFIDILDKWLAANGVAANGVAANGVAANEIATHGIDAMVHQRPWILYEMKFAA